MKVLQGLTQKTDEDQCKSAHATVKNSFGKKHSIQSTTITEFSIQNSLAEKFVKLDLDDLKFTRRFKKQHVIPVKTLMEIDEEDNEDRFIDNDEFDCIQESHSISRNRISLRGIGKLRRSRIFKTKKPKTGYVKIQNPDIETDLLDIHFDY